MGEILYKIEFHEYFHLGTGLKGSTIKDSLVIKDKNKLPFVPGNTIKGILRHAAKDIQQFYPEYMTDDAIHHLFGMDAPERTSKDKKGESNYLDTIEQVHFTDALLPQSIQAYVLDDDHKKKNMSSFLYRNIASTQITKNGIAKENSLRQIEVCIPLTFFGKIINVSSEYEEQIKKSTQFVKRMGQWRNRGIGRCTISIIENTTI